MQTIILKTKSSYLLYALLVAVFLVGCETKGVQINSTDTSIYGRTIQTYVIDSCEYIGSVHGGHGDILTHKGNCKFCLARDAGKHNNTKQTNPIICKRQY